MRTCFSGVRAGMSQSGSNPKLPRSAALHVRAWPQSRQESIEGICGLSRSTMSCAVLLGETGTPLRTPTAMRIAASDAARCEEYDVFHPQSQATALACGVAQMPDNMSGKAQFRIGDACRRDAAAAPASAALGAGRPPRLSFRPPSNSLASPLKPLTKWVSSSMELRSKLNPYPMRICRQPLISDPRTVPNPTANRIGSRRAKPDHLARAGPAPSPQPPSTTRGGPHHR